MNIEELRKLHEEATPRPWKVMDGRKAPATFVARPDGRWIARMTEGIRPEDNAALIVALRNSAPAILRVLEAAEEISDPFVFDAGGDRWWKAHDSLRAALAELESQP